MERRTRKMRGRRRREGRRAKRKSTFDFKEVARILYHVCYLSKVSADDCFALPPTFRASKTVRLILLPLSLVVLQYV